MTTYIKNKNAMLVIADEKTGTSVSFPAYLNSLDIKADYGVTLSKSKGQNIPDIAQSATTFTYNLSIQVVGNTVRDAINNYTSIQKLTKAIQHPDSPSGIDDYTNYFQVVLSNIIQNGTLTGPKTSDTSSAKSAKLYGIKCIIASVNTAPDVSMGFYEYNGFQYPKIYELSLTLVVKATFDYGNKTRVIAASFENNGEYEGKDVKHWPFGINVFGLKDSNDLLFQKNGSDASQLYAVNKGAMIGFADAKAPKHTVFEAFLENYSFKRETNYQQQINEGTAVSTMEIGAGIKDNIYSLSFNCVAHSVNEAMTNLVKLQHLIRFPIKNENDDGLPKGTMYAYFQNLIAKSHQPSFGDIPGFSKIKGYGMYCAISSMSISIDNDIGYFDHKSFFIPKVLNVSMELVVADPTIVGEAGTAGPPGSGGSGGSGGSSYENDVDGILG